MQKLTTIFGNIVPMFFSNNSGVSISEVNRRQAEAKQQNDEFWGTIQDAVSGFFQKVVTFVGGGQNDPRELGVITITTEDIAAYTGVAERNSHTAVLMHGLKLYKSLMQRLQSMDLTLFIGEAIPVAPERPKYQEAPDTPQRPTVATLCDTETFMDLGSIDEMIASLRPEVLAQFDFAFFKKANGLNARAAAIGKLLSEQGSFFRQLVRPLPKGSEQALQTGVVFTSWKKAYTAEQLREFAQYRDTLQAEYNDLQKQLNGLKKQIKDAVRAYNLQSERSYQASYGAYQLKYAEYQNAVAKQQEDYQRLVNEYRVAMERVRSSAETLRQQALQEIATLRVRTE